MFWGVTAIGLFLIAGYTFDGGSQISAVQRAQFIAGEAARYGAQEIVGPTGMYGEGAVVDPEAAKTAAEYYLSRIPDVTGTVSVVDGSVVVDTRCTRKTQFLGLISISTVGGNGHSKVDLVRAVDGVAK